MQFNRLCPDIKCKLYIGDVRGVVLRRVVDGRRVGEAVLERTATQAGEATDHALHQQIKI